MVIDCASRVDVRCDMRLRSFVLVLLAGFALLRPATAGELVPVDLELVLAVDISLSMDPDEQQLQRDG